MTAVSDHRHLVERYVGAYVTGDTSYLSEIIAADFVDHSVLGYSPGPGGIASAIELMQSAFTDLELATEHCVSQAEWVAFRMVVAGTHVGEFRGKPPTGNRVVFAAADFARVRQGQFVELWSVQDTAALLVGVGARLI